MNDPKTLGFFPERLQRIGVALNHEIETGQLPGAVLAISRGGELAFCESFGHLDPSARTPMREDAMFSIASMTKPMVAVGALMLFEEGRLMLNDPVAKYLPRLANMRVGKPGCDGTPAMTEPQARDMTVQDLMRHTSGLAYGRGPTPLHKIYPFSSDTVAVKSTGAEFLEQLASLPLHHQPGSAWEYGFGFDVLGLVIEAAVKQPLGEYLQERLFGPLKMLDTSFVVAAKHIPRYAKALPIDPITREPQKLRDGTTPHKFDCGGGCAVSTARDYMRFAQMLLNGGELDGARILARKTVEYMTSDHIGPEINTTKIREYPNINGYGFGLGVAVRRATGIAPIMSSKDEFHWAGSTGTYFWVDPSEALVVVFMSHAPGAIRYYHRQLLHSLVNQSLA